MAVELLTGWPESVSVQVTVDDHRVRVATMTPASDTIRTFFATGSIQKTYQAIAFEIV